MDQLVEFSDIENTGRNILNENKFFSDLCSLMKNVEFVKFYDNYFKDWSDIECMMFYMKLYSTIAYEYKSRYNKDITDETMTYMLHNIMKNGKSRKLAFDIFNRYKKEYGHESTEGFRKELKFT